MKTEENISSHRSQACWAGVQLIISAGWNQRLISAAAALTESLTWHRFFSLLTAKSPLTTRQRENKEDGEVS
jgi:hypothetical protein